jgi:hypothetical protein
VAVKRSSTLRLTASLSIVSVLSPHTRTLVLSSGNNVGPVGDMARRCITINLDANCEMPATRSFMKDPLGDALKSRESVVSAALTIVRAWISAGEPMTECATLGSFGAWSRWCRQPLLWLGKPDPAASAFAAMTDDPDRDLLVACSCCCMQSSATPR